MRAQADELRYALNRVGDAEVIVKTQSAEPENGRTTAKIRIVVTNARLEAGTKFARQNSRHCCPRPARE